MLLARKISIQSQYYERIFSDFVFAEDGSVRLGVYPLMVMGLLSPKIMKDLRGPQDLFHHLGLSCGTRCFHCFDEFGPERMVETLSKEDFLKVLHALKAESNTPMHQVEGFLEQHALKYLNRLENASGIHNLLFSFWNKGQETEIVAHRDECGNFWWRATQIGELLGLGLDGHDITKGLPEDYTRLMSNRRFLRPMEALATLRLKEAPASSCEQDELELPPILARRKDSTLERSSNNQQQIPERKVVAINEAGLYMLIFRSEKPEAENFKNWLAKEVIPSIRKTGSYSTGIDDCSRIPSIYKQNIINERNRANELHSHYTKAKETLISLQSKMVDELANLTADFDKTISKSMSFTEWDITLKAHAKKLRRAKALLEARSIEFELDYAMPSEVCEYTQYEHKQPARQCMCCGSINKMNPNCFLCSGKHLRHSFLICDPSYYFLIPAAKDYSYSNCSSILEDRSE